MDGWMDGFACRQIGIEIDVVIDSCPVRDFLGG